MDLMTWLRAEWDRVLGFTLIALGAVLLVLGYIGVSDSPYVAEQLSYIVSGGLGGLFLLGAGATLLILADLHDEWRKLDRVEAMLSGEIPFVPTAAADERRRLRLRPRPSPAGRRPHAPAPAPAEPAPALMVEAPWPTASRPAGDRSGPTAAAVLRKERFSLGIGLLLACRRAVRVVGPGGQRRPAEAGHRRRRRGRSSGSCWWRSAPSAPRSPSSATCSCARPGSSPPGSGRRKPGGVGAGGRRFARHRRRV